MSGAQLRIAMLSVHSCPIGNPGTKDTGGMNVYIRELARELAAQDISVDIYTRVHDPEDAQIVELADCRIRAKYPAYSPQSRGGQVYKQAGSLFPSS
ncbi:MAG: glycosyltransferase [Deltaproteobacteria bacterium]|nr:glycosyltransferase [Deltaproteobacteria bacterium]